MKGLKGIFQDKNYCRDLFNPSVELDSTSGHRLAITFDSKENVVDAGYVGQTSLELATLCELIRGKNINQLLDLSKDDWRKVWGDDPFFSEFWNEKENEVFFFPLELLRATLDQYRGREYLYQNSVPIVCRCFGLTENEIIEGGAKTRAGMGCRSCRHEVNLLLQNKVERNKRFIKGKSTADWLLLVDEKLSDYRFSEELGMQVEGIKHSGIIISYRKEITQIEEEKISRELQSFFDEALGGDFSFFLKRA